MSKNTFRNFNTSSEIIRLAVMMYVRFPLSLRNVEDLLHEFRIDVCHESVRHWWNRFGPMFASEILKKRSQSMRQSPQWRWHLNEVFVKIKDKQQYLWCAVDHEGEVLESCVTKRWDRKAALKFLRKAMKWHGNPEVMVTDRLASYRSALRVTGNQDGQEAARWANNRAANLHLPFRRRERAMLRFRKMRNLQKFASIHSSVHNTSIIRETSNAEPDSKNFDMTRFSNGVNFSMLKSGTSIGCWRLIRIKPTAPIEVLLNGQAPRWYGRTYPNVAERANDWYRPGASNQRTVTNRLSLAGPVSRN